MKDVANDSKKKKALVIASVASMLDNFNRSNIDVLLSLGYRVVIAANFHTKEDTNSQDKIDEFSEEMRVKGVECVHIDFSRRIRNISLQVKSIRQVRELLERQFNLVHCHSPICSVIVRKEAQKYRKKYETKVVYTAHGFHFFTGAPLKNWLVYYPIEKIMSKYTDVLITINQEDFKRATEKFHAIKTIHIPGIGIDTRKFKKRESKRELIRNEIGIKADDIVLLSVGELNSNKNHEIVIRALSKLPDNIVYIVAGIGILESYLRDVATTVGVQDRVRLIGFRKDMSYIYNAADIFVFPSFREGLSVSLMEAMASGLPVACSKIRGNVDLIDEGKGGFCFDPFSLDSVVDIIKKVLRKNMTELGEYNVQKIRKFDIENVKRKMEMEYRELILL